MLKSLINRFKPASAPAAPQHAVPLSVEPLVDRKGEPGTRVHSEYFIDVKPDAVYWTARVYAANGAPNEQTGFAPNESAARDAAINWCNETKTKLGGV